MKTYLENKKGVTFVELIVAMVILGIISTITYQFLWQNQFVVYNKGTTKSQTQQMTRATIDAIVNEIRTAREVELINPAQVKSVEEIIAENEADNADYRYLFLNQDYQIEYRSAEGSRLLPGVPTEILFDVNFQVERKERNDFYRFFLSVDLMGIMRDYQYEVDTEVQLLNIFSGSAIHNAFSEDNKTETKKALRINMQGNLLPGLGPDPNLPDAEWLDFIDSVFVFGSQLHFAGSNIIGLESTMFITGGVNSSNFNGGSNINVSNILIDGNANMINVNSSIGSSSSPGNIVINGNYINGTGQRNIYGTVYINGDFDLGQAWVHGDVYVNGDFIISTDRSFNNFLNGTNGHIYYTGNISVPSYFNTSHSNFPATKVDTVPIMAIPAHGIPQLRDASWYEQNNYVSSGLLESNMKIYASSYTSTAWRPSASNVVIVAEGDITITGIGSSSLSGVLFSRNGRVTFGGSSFTGTVIAKNGFYVTSGGTDVTFKSVGDFFSNVEDYPFE
ncbi:PilW family protein [Desulfuribacillus alkaliarsenatis]|uniref:Prepilin-type N-terminal cleavage/methylation domain-containing protein n=1 Tax=Desulfuribacillus alkaliarsenatis TaxID=766136 RepID=A0A1E5G6F4_9FIRM|nr:prepilin-type N-terminal cleavage/methylation domain-containing protein [Desulfuribacillus alkaliarsenatis]OEF98334.1 hypothetical protein BHF68_01245 [Desulfuribacillus alkaliarsenatis]